VGGVVFSLVKDVGGFSSLEVFARFRFWLRCCLLVDLLYIF
jgi:hypothetical protein